MPETLLDVRGLICPLPVLKANKSLRSLAAGAVLRVLATDPASMQDFPAFCAETGHSLLATEEKEGVFAFLLRKNG